MSTLDQLNAAEKGGVVELVECDSAVAFHHPTPPCAPPMQNFARGSHNTRMSIAAGACLGSFGYLCTIWMLTPHLDTEPCCAARFCVKLRCWYQCQAPRPPATRTVRDLSKLPLRPASWPLWRPVAGDLTAAPCMRLWKPLLAHTLLLSALLLSTLMSLVLQLLPLLPLPLHQQRVTLGERRRRSRRQKE